MNQRWILCLIACIALVAMPREARAGSCCSSHRDTGTSSASKNDARAVVDRSALAAESSRVASDMRCMFGCPGCLCGCNPEQWRHVSAATADTEIALPDLGTVTGVIAIVVPEVPTGTELAFTTREPAHQRVKRREGLLRHCSVLPLRN